MEADLLRGKLQQWLRMIDGVLPRQANLVAGLNGLPTAALVEACDVAIEELLDHATRASRAHGPHLGEKDLVDVYYADAAGEQADTTLAGLPALLRSGAIVQTTKIWLDGMDQWETLADAMRLEGGAGGGIATDLAAAMLESHQSPAALSAATSPSHGERPAAEEAGYEVDDDAEAAGAAGADAAAAAEVRRLEAEEEAEEAEKVEDAEEVEKAEDAEEVEECDSQLRSTVELELELYDEPESQRYDDGTMQVQLLLPSPHTPCLLRRTWSPTARAGLAAARG